MTTSESTASIEKTNLRCRGRYLAMLGLFLMLGPVVSFLFAFYAIAPPFFDVELVSEVDRSSQIHRSMMVSMWGLGAAILGTIFVSIAVLAAKNRERWVYRNGLFLGVILCLAGGMFGVVFGVALIIILATRRGEFAVGENGTQNKPTLASPTPPRVD